MAIRRAQASVLSGINGAANGWLDNNYNTANARYIPTAFSSVTSYTATTTWTRPTNVHFIDIALVGGGGSSSQTVTGPDGGGGQTTRRGGGGGGAAVIQVNRFYVADYDLWYIVIGGNSAISDYGTNNCNGNSWGRSGNPTIFTPFNASAFNAQNLFGVDTSNLRRTIIAPGGGGGGHPCGSPGPLSLVSSGGTGSNNNSQTFGAVPGTNNQDGKVPWQGYGGRGGVSGNQTAPGGGGGGSGATASGSTGGTGRTLQTPFSGCYGGGGAGGSGTSGGCGGGSPGVAGTNGTGGGGGAASAARTDGRTGGTGRVEIRMWFS